MGFLSDIANTAKQVFVPGSGGVSLGNFGGLTDFIPGIGDAAAEKRANEANRAEAALNREFQERMSNTAYQRAMKDMRAAGLNPILAYQQGGASTPSGAQAQFSPESKTRLGDFALQATTGLSNARSQATAVQQQQAVNESAIQLNKANTAKSVSDAESTRVETELKRKNLPRAKLEGEISEKISRGLRKILSNFESSAEDVKKNNKEPLIKKLGPVDKKDTPSGIADWLMNKGPK